MSNSKKKVILVMCICLLGYRLPRRWRRGYEAPKTMAAPVRTNQMNQVIRHSITTFGAVDVNVNKSSDSVDAGAFIPNYHINLLASFLFAAPGSIYILLCSLISFRIKFSNFFFNRQYLLFYINQIYEVKIYLILTASTVEG